MKTKSSHGYCGVNSATDVIHLDFTHAFSWTCDETRAPCCIKVTPVCDISLWFLSFQDLGTLDLSWTAVFRDCASVGVYPMSFLD